jgi:hypothetical protein
MTARTGGAADPQAQSSGLRVTPVDGGADLDRFIRLPMRLYSGWKGFVAPLVMERPAVLRRDKNPYFSHGTAQYWLAWRGDRPVGRISACRPTVSGTPRQGCRHFVPSTPRMIRRSSAPS